jgi:CHRD domain/Secretion system C-terminal sorting domain
MKKLYFSLFFLVCISTTFFAQTKDGRIVLYARLSGANEVPTVTTKAKGLFTFVIEPDYATVTVNGVVDSLSGPITASHIHQGSAGVNGSSFINFASMVKGNRIYGQFKPTKAQLALMLTRGAYVNVHTAANTGGEIRGQILVESDLSFAAGLLAANEVPAVNNPSAWGVGSFTLGLAYDKMDYKIAVTGLTGPITAAHLHFGSADRTGRSFVPLTIQGKYLSGTINADSLQTANGFLDSLFAQKVYVNVHTAANTSGEIRAQLTLVSFIAADAVAVGNNEVPAVTSPARGLMFAYPNFTLDTISYFAVYDSLTPTNAHIHIGAKGINGSSIVPLAAIAGVRGYSGRFEAKPDTMVKFLTGQLYMNIHTAANTAGEIRDQLSTTVRDAYIANLCAGQEVPAVTNAWNASGAGMVSLDRNRTNAHIEIVTNGLSANATNAHIHKGAKGATGSSVIGFGTALLVGGNALSGIASVTALSSTFLDSIQNGLTYINVHTALNTAGEIRGQLGKTFETTCIPTGVYEANGQPLSVKIFPNPMSETLNLDFEANEDFTAQIVLTDLLGRSVFQKNQNVLRGVNALNLNTQQFANGVYFIQLKKGNQLLFTEKVIKQ